MDVVEQEPAGVTVLMFSEKDRVLSRVTPRFFAYLGGGHSGVEHFNFPSADVLSSLLQGPYFTDIKDL